MGGAAHWRARGDRESRTIVPARDGRETSSGAASNWEFLARRANEYVASGVVGLMAGGAALLLFCLVFRIRSFGPCSVDPLVLVALVASAAIARLAAAAVLWMMRTQRRD